MSVFSKVYFAMASAAYWFGLISGWYGRHYSGVSDSNPDTWIHSSLLFGSIFWLVDSARKYRTKVAKP